jgi:hypothetical protein
MLEALLVSANTSIPHPPVSTVPLKIPVQELESPIVLYSIVTLLIVLPFPWAKLIDGRGLVVPGSKLVV